MTTTLTLQIHPVMNHRLTHHLQDSIRRRLIRKHITTFMTMKPCLNNSSLHIIYTSYRIFSVRFHLGWLNRLVPQMTRATRMQSKIHIIQATVSTTRPLIKIRAISTPTTHFRTLNSRVNHSISTNPRVNHINNLTSLRTLTNHITITSLPTRSIMKGTISHLTPITSRVRHMNMIAKPRITIITHHNAQVHNQVRNRRPKQRTAITPISSLLFSISRNRSPINVNVSSNTSRASISISK